jgi:hypothetical protein
LSGHAAGLFPAPADRDKLSPTMHAHNGATQTTTPTTLATILDGPRERSPYQILAVNNIVESIEDNRGNGYIWYTTDSGKTGVSFRLLHNPTFVYMSGCLAQECGEPPAQRLGVSHFAFPQHEYAPTQ